MVSTRAVLAAVLVPVAVVLLAVVIIVIGRGNATGGPDCVTRTATDGSDSLVCGSPAATPATASSLPG